MRFATCALLLVACSGEAFSSRVDEQLVDGGVGGAAVATGGMENATGASHATGGASGGRPGTGGTEPSGGVGNSGAGGYQGGSPSTGGVFVTGGVPATGGVTTGGAAGSATGGGCCQSTGGSAGGGAGGAGGAVATGGTSPFGTCVQVGDGTCGTEAQTWECDDFRAGPYNPGYRCNPWAATLGGTWCCVPWDGGSVLSTCETNADCAECAGTNTYPLCCRYDIETADPLSPWTCGCGQVTTCLPNVEAQ